MASQNILILSSDTGGGHRSAARALENSLTELNPGEIIVKITQVLEESCHASRKLADLYNFILRERQDMMKYYYWAINAVRPNESPLIFNMAKRYGVRVMEKHLPKAIVSVHPMTQHFFSFILRRLDLINKIPFVTVVTDPCDGFWQGWACQDVNHYFVASEAAKEQLIHYGVEAGRISIAGMPVHSKFQPVSQEVKHYLRRSYDMEPETFTLFMNAGWAGGGNTLKIFEYLTKCPLDIQVVFLTGKNEGLADRVRDLSYRATFPVKIMGYSDNIQHLMNMSDVMVSKLGGLTTFEAMACQLPIIGDAVTEPMPQEYQTANFIEKTGTGILLRQPQEIMSVVQSLVNSPERLNAMQEAASLHAKPGASDRIAREVLELISKQPLIETR